MPLSATKTGRERASDNAERHRWPEMPAAGEQPRRTAPPRVAFWLMAGVFCLMFFAAGAPTPLYGVYQAQLRFSATTLTAIFAIYALVLLLTLLVFGSVSDYLGRRPVILAALVMSAGACAVFLTANRAGLLFAARALQGVAVGTAIGALGAALIDLQPEGSGLAPLITAAAPALGWEQARWAPVRWPSTGRRPPAWCGGCCSPPARPPPPGYWRCPSPGPGAPAS